MVKNQKTDYKSLLDLTTRLRKLIRSSHTISVSLVLDEAIRRIVFETCESLNCDKASVYLRDELNEELWTKTDQHLKIRQNMKEGVIGSVAATGEAARIEDAY